MKKSQIARIVPPPSCESGLTRTQGTKVYVGDEILGGVTKIEITCELDDIWRAVIHCNFQPTDLSAVAVVHVPTSWQKIKIWWANQFPARRSGSA